MRTVLWGLGALGLGYALLEPERALVLAQQWGRRGVEEAMVWLGLPGQFVLGVLAGIDSRT